MDRIINLIRKVLTKEVILYGIFGVLTTLVNFVSFYVFSSLLGLEENFANILSIFIAILFAYFTNRKWVFNSTAKTFKEIFSEFYKFFLGRLFSLAVETVGFFLLFNVIGIDKLISKLFISVIIIVLNFFISKFFAFKK